ncbi:MAG: YcgN family cysteine cluster protein [Proteobacteria bacterium]|nr:YcgN family cysteine cluster protein [Pseudomonadota bacterium]
MRAARRPPASPLAWPRRRRRRSRRVGEAAGFLARPAAGEAPPFWKRKTLAEMSREEWESLCDGCARCCLIKLEDADSGEILFTNVACRLLHPGTCRCTDYPDRKRRVPDCVQLSPETIGSLAWLPATCGYRLVHEGKALYWWHPLVSGDPNTVHEAGISVRGRVVSEDDARDPEAHVVEWAK